MHVAGDLGEVAVGGEADRTAEHGTDLLEDAGFDLASKIHGSEQGTFATHETAGHFVDGQDGGYGKAAFDGFDNAAMVVDVDFVAGLDEDDVRAHAFGVGDDGSGADAEGLGFIAGGDAAGGIGHHGNDADGPAAQFGADFLLDRSKVGVQVDEEPVDRGASDRFLGEGGGSVAEVDQVLPAIPLGGRALSGLGSPATL